MALCPLSQYKWIFFRGRLANAACLVVVVKGLLKL